MQHQTDHIHDHPQKSKDQLSGPQGVDKGPTDDPADQPTQGSTIADTQKAKKVDADPEEEQKNKASS